MRKDKSLKKSSPFLFVLMLFAFFSFARASTLVVDNSGTSSCENNFSHYTTIQDAVNVANNGDTIKICKGDYQESVTINGINDLNITSGADVNSPADVNWHSSGNTLTVDDSTKNLSISNVSINSSSTSSNNKNIHIKKAQGQITFQNLAIETKGAEAIYVENNVNSNLEGHFKDLTIVSGGDGIRINRGSTQEFENLNITITSNSGNGIFLGSNVQDKNHSFKHLAFSANAASAINLNSGKAMDFEDINITASGYSDSSQAIALQNNLSSDANLKFTDIAMNLNAGVGINIQKAKNTQFKNIIIKGSSQWGIWLRNNVTGTPTFGNITLKANHGGGIYVEKGGNVNIDTATITGIDGNGYAVRFASNVNGNYVFTDVNITTDTEGIYVQKGGNVNFKHMTIQGNGNSANDFGIHTTSNVTGSIQIENSDINVSGKALYIQKGTPTIQYSRFETRMGENTLDLGNGDKVQLTNSCIYRDSSSGNAYGLKLQNGISNNNVANNCFYKKPDLQYLAYANKKQTNVSNNYWDGLSASSYDYNNITDSSPLSSCPNDCDNLNTPSTQPKPIADYRMDECSWDGTTGEVADSAGGDNNGTIAGADINTTDDDTIIHNAGSFGGGAIDINDLNVSTANGAKTTVMFWMYWDGTDDVMPFGWNKYDLWFNADSFGFNTSNSDVYGISSSGLANGWHHVTAVFTNGNYKTNTLYIDDVNQTLTKQLNNPGNDQYSYVNTSARIGGWRNTNGYRFKGKLDELKIYNGELNASDIKTIYDNEKAGKNYDGSTRSPSCCIDRSYRYSSCLYTEVFEDYKFDSGWSNYKNGVVNQSTLEMKYCPASLEKTTNNDSNGGWKSLNQSVDRNYYFEGWIYRPSNYTGGAQDRLAISDSNFNGYGFAVTGSKVTIERRDAGKAKSISSTNWTRQNDVWYRFRFQANSDNTFTIHLYDENGTEELALTSNTDTKYSGNFDRVVVHGGHEYYIDGLSVRRCAPIVPVADFHLDKCSWSGAQGEVKDSSGNDHNGTIEGTPTTKDGGVLCKSGLFDNNNSDSQAISVPDSDALSPHVDKKGKKGEMTVSAWIKALKYPDTSKQGRVPIVAKGTDDNWEYALYLEDWKGVGFSVWQKNGTSYGEPNGGNLTLNEWHQLVGVVKKGKYVRIYLDGQMVKEETNLHGDTKNGTSPLYIARRGSGNHYFDGYIDEVKIFDKALTDSQIQAIYNNEKNGKNYDGTSRTCQVCPVTGNKTTYFNAVSSASQCNAANDWDNNLTTQIVKNNFNLWILSKEDANATVASEANVTKVELKFYGGGNTTDCDNATYKSSQALCDDASATICQDTNASGCMLLSNVNLGNASRCIQVYIEGKDINNTSSDINTSYSSDDFAIRPKKFAIVAPVTPLHAGEDFNLTFQALNANDENSTDYNETRNTSFEVDANITNTNCNLGNFSLNTFSFSNGQKNDVNASYSEVGDLNITIKEINGSEFAKVDADDTPDTQRVIEKNSTILSFRPYQFSIINYAFSRNNPDADWRYMADVNESNISISFNVQAQNEQNQTTQNFDAECAAENVNVKIDLNVTNDDANASYFERINNTETFGNDKNLSDINFNGTVNDNNFTDGVSSDIIYALNVYRVYNQVKNPRTIEVVEVNTTSTNVKNIGLSPENNSSAFYYARLYTQDLSTSKTSDTVQAKVLVYDSLVDNYVSDLNLTEELSNWYYYKPQNDASNGNITDLNVSRTTRKESTSDGISATSSFKGNGTFDINVSNDENNTKTHYIHLSISPWLWYVYKNFGRDYNDSAGSSCSDHPCIKYNYHRNDDNESGVSSGNVNGVEFDVNVSKNSRGIRLLR